MVKDPLIGRLVDSRYEIVAQVARGGMATVYRAQDRRLDRDVALKLMHAHLADSPEFVARFRREARAAARLSNPGVVAVYDQGSLDGVAYLVMEYVEGPSLRDLIAAGPLSVGEALGLVAQVLRPLGAAHRAGLVHRDIKPENVLLPADGAVAKVADFGLARAVTEVAQTTTGNVLGTVAYLAPELITSGASTARADVFSVGVVLYELLTGSLPFHADSPIQVAFRNVHEDVPLPSTTVPQMSANVDELVRAMTRRDPLQRPGDADAALTLLRHVAGELTGSDLSVRPGGGTGSERTHEVMAANARAARSAMAEAPEPDQERDTPSAGMRTVSLPIGSIGPEPAETGTRQLPRRSLLTGDRTQQTVPVPSEATSQDSARRRYGRRALLTGAGVLVLAGGGYATWYRTVGPGRRITVPDIVGMTQQEAHSAVEGQGLVWASPVRAYSDTVAAGLVISSTPGAGERVTRDRAVTAVVSRGRQRVDVPDVVGMSEEEATDTLEEAGLGVEVSRVLGGLLGKVRSIEPPAGTSVTVGSTVTVTVL
nr:Stk1 family PASTA domain-containing Ser/Thr kinase [Actinomyces wuliandei]